MKKIIAIILVLAVLGGGFYFYRQRVNVQKESTSEIPTITVSEGDVLVTVKADGKLESVDTRILKAVSGLHVEDIPVEKGDRISQGDVLCTFTRSSVRRRLAELAGEIEAIDKGITQTRTNNSIKAPISGRVKYLPVQEKDEVLTAIANYGCLALLSTDDLMQVEVETDLVYEMGKEVTVRWNGGSEDGTIAKKTVNGYIVTFDDAKAPYLEMAEVYDGAALLGAGPVEIHVPYAVLGSGGSIDSIETSLNRDVSSGATLFNLENDPLRDDIQITLDERAEKLELYQSIIALEEDPHFYSPVDGVLRSVSVEEDRDIGNPDGSGKAEVFSIDIGGPVIMRLDVDELDVSNVRIGEAATVTLDAWEDAEFEGVVTWISALGTASGTVTTYDTKVELSADERLLEGLNGRASISADKAENVLIIPVGAIEEDGSGSYVNIVNANGENAKQYIKTGLSDGQNVEVTEGLSLNDRILYKESGISTAAMLQQVQNSRNMLLGGLSNE